MKSLQFEKRQLHYLASTLFCKPHDILYLCANVQDYYDKWIEPKVDKKTGAAKLFPDGSPKQRVIRPSFKKLKLIQKSIKLNILDKIELPKNIQGGIKKKSNITNAKEHQGKTFQFTTDLQDFFPSITHQQIYNLYLLLGYSDHVSHWLTKLTSIEFELPQGTPTSTAIANLVFYETDKKLIQLSKKYNLTYTRFVDDLTFSSPKDFRFLTNHILDIVRDGQFKISYRKTKYQVNQTITGIEVFNNYIDAPSKIKAKAKIESEKMNLTSSPYTNYLQRIRSTNRNVKKST